MFIVRNLVSAIALTAMLGACATPTMWVKPGANQEEFSKTRYQCLKENQVPYSTSSLYGTGGRYAFVSGGSQSGVTTDVGMAKACMNSHGYREVPVPKKAQPEATEGSK